jgi:hypothetical protein
MRAWATGRSFPVSVVGRVGRVGIAVSLQLFGSHTIMLYILRFIRRDMWGRRGTAGFGSVSLPVTAEAAVQDSIPEADFPGPILRISCKRQNRKDLFLLPS